MTSSLFRRKAANTGEKPAVKTQENVSVSDTIIIRQEFQVYKTDKTEGHLYSACRMIQRIKARVVREPDEFIHVPPTFPLIFVT